jgi:hypothetical protein
MSVDLKFTAPLLVVRLGEISREEFTLDRLTMLKLKLLNSADSNWLGVLNDIKETRERCALRKLATEFTNKLNVVRNQFNNGAETLFIEKFVLNSDITLLLLIEA